MNAPDTIAAIATPMGEGGIGVVRVSGPNAISIVVQFFEPSKKQALLKIPGSTCIFGRITTPPSSSAVAGEGSINPLSPAMDPPPVPAEDDNNRPKGETLDQAVVTVFRAPRSYTGEEVVEISAHGSPYILGQILKLCTQAGARLAGPGEFTERAFLNGKLDLTQAEAVGELIRAKTDRAHAAAVAQLEGHLSRRVRALRDQLLPLLAHLEVGLDHSDEDHDFLARESLKKNCASVRADIQQILHSAQTSKILREGLRVALCGRPNVGKSSLLNALLNEDRAIVTPIAGTTRDTLEENVNWAGLPVVLTDTAGVRETPGDAIEQLGIERSLIAINTADVVVALFDASAPLTGDDRTILEAAEKKPHLWVANKSDLPSAWSDEQLAALNGGSAIVRVSAKTGNGLSDLVEKIKSHVGDASGGEAQWMLNARHQDALRRALDALKGAEHAAADTFEECVALELQTAMGALGEIIGETTTEDLLGQIFSSFCIGK